MAELLPCTCGSDDITVYEERVMFLSKTAIITCRKCKRSVRCHSLNKAIFVWNNVRTPKERGADNG